ncbi:hypothetical protein U1282_10420 [Enterococcus cecorum]|uniref:hypothetical protein n=1 Tax=Enterococcus cecorum TaxID=44008 RepID=UPI002ACA001E|nr:hypothetical protein [Enterococcus cecorum]MDZ5600885.1 hypothetical protein [Enterococcus cecorum]
MRQFLSFLVSIDLLFILAGCQSTASKSAETHESTQKTSLSRTVPSNSTTTSTQQATTQTLSKTYHSLSDIPKTITQTNHSYHLIRVQLIGEVFEATFTSKK